MKKLLVLLFSLLISFNSYGASDEPTRYVYGEFNIDNASKYTISTGSMHEFSCLLTQTFFSQEALSAAKNKKKFDFMNSDFTPTSIDLYKNKVYWVDIDLNTKIKNNFVKFENMGLSDEDQLFELMHKDDELIFRMETPHEGSTLVCDFPFNKVELDEDGLPIKTTCWQTDGNWREDNTFYLTNPSEPFTGKNKCYHSNGNLSEEGYYKNGKVFGNWNGWHENGQKSYESFSKEFIPYGEWTGWHENGEIASKEEYKNGIPYGERTFWYENGQVKKKVYYKDGMMNGVLTVWHENGQKKQEITYKDDEPISRLTEWNEDGVCKWGDC